MLTNAYNEDSYHWKYEHGFREKSQEDCSLEHT